MASAIDPSKPTDGVPASKADLRANLQTAKTELDHGGFAEAFTPANYGPPASSRVRDHLAALDAIIPSLGEAVGLGGWADVKASFGVVGNGSTNDTAALQNALNSGSAVVYLPPGTYRVTAQLNVAPGTKLVGAGAGRTIIDGRTASPGAAGAILHCSGTTVALPALASSIAKSAGTISYASSIASSLKHGDWVRIVDNTANSMGNDTALDGFVCFVQSAEGSILYPGQPALRTLPSPVTGGALANVQSTKLDQRGLIVEDLTVYGPGFDSTSGSSGINGGGIYALLLANVYFTRVRILGGGDNGIGLDRCANVHVTDCDVSLHNGDNTSMAYGLHVRGSSYVYAQGCTLNSVRHAVDINSRLGPSHTVVIANSVICAPGTSIFQQPTTTSMSALDWHRGTYDCKVIGCHIQGCVVIRGEAMEVLNCTIENGGTDHAALGMIDAIEFGPRLDARIIGNRLICRMTHFESGGGVVFQLDPDDWAAVAGSIGSLVFADNDIYLMFNTTNPLINIQSASVKSPATGVVHITNNRVAHAAGASSRPFANISITDGVEVIVANNSMPANVTLGTIGTDFTRRVTFPNVINGHLNFAGIPTASPGGTGRLWSDGGTLKVT